MNINTEMKSSLIETNAYLKSIFDLVPPKAYFDADANQKLSAHRTHVASGRDLPTDAAKGKKVVKKGKLDPSQPSKISQLQTILPELEAAHAALEYADEPVVSHLINGQTNEEGNEVEPMETQSDSDDPSSSEDEPPKSNGKGLKRSRNTKQKNSHKKEGSSSASNNSSTGPSPLTVAGKLNPDQLREKLRARISELQSKRQHGMTAEEFLESKKLRRKESKLKLKQKRKEAKKLKLSVEKQAKNSHNKLNGVSEVKPEVDKNTNNSNKMVFSKFEFSEQAKKPKERKAKKPKSYKDLYEKVTKEKQKLDELKQTDADKAKKIEEKAAWRKAMDQSKGVKVKDNPELIKKSMKKEEKMKQRASKKWQERTEQVAEQQQKRQDKRKKNIQAKRQTKVDRKIKLAKKKGRIVSGF